MRLLSVLCICTYTTLSHQQAVELQRQQAALDEHAAALEADKAVAAEAMRAAEAAQAKAAQQLAQAVKPAAEKGFQVSTCGDKATAHRDRLWYKNENGAIVYFSDFWKMNGNDSKRGWHYEAKKHSGPPHCYM